MENCVFCGIVKNNTPHHEIWHEDENHIAFLDIYPCQKGHTLVIPKKHSDGILDLSEDEYVDLFKTVHKVSKKLKTFSQCKKISVVVDGYSVAHTHVHLIPTNKEGDLGDFPRYTLAEGELPKIGQELKDFKEV
jgi:histidine triad (HIT) family protein